MLASVQEVPGIVPAPGAPKPSDMSREGLYLFRTLGRTTALAWTASSDNRSGSECSSTITDGDICGLLRSRESVPFYRESADKARKS
jgi:hypothetical protein